MNKLDTDYQALLADILENGRKKRDRTGTGTISVFGREIRHDMRTGFPLLTTKKMYMKGVIAELIWFLRGETNIKFLVDNGCHIWDGDAYKAFERWKIETDAKIRRDNPTIDFQPLEYESKEEFVRKIKEDADFAEKWGDLGPIYGFQWRKWDSYTDVCVDNEWEGGQQGGSWKHKRIDQIETSMKLLKNDPDSRRNRVSAWNVGDLSEMALPPCHTDFQLYTRELDIEERREWCRENGVVLDHLEAGLENETDDMRANRVPERAISLKFSMRSNDVPLGLPFNLASYGLLLEIYAKAANMVTEELIATLGDAHIYVDQIDGIKEQLSRQPYELPKIKHAKDSSFYRNLFDDINLITHLEISDFALEGYQSHPAIKMPLSN